jgi:NitT/TauT family transport system permease protein
MWLPAPALVADRFVKWSLNGVFGLNGAITIGETVIGLGLGTAGALVVGLALGYYSWLRRAMYPLALLCYSVPLAALAPPFTAVLGLGLASKIALTSITAFFLLFFSVLSGAAAINGRLIAVLQIMGASDREILVKLFLPASKEWIITGLRTAAPFSLLTAITAEIWGSRMGLGFLVKSAVETTDIAGMYAVLIVLAIVGVTLNTVVGGLKRFGGDEHAA